MGHSEYQLLNMIDQKARLADVIKLSEPLRNGDAYLTTGAAMSEVRALGRGVDALVDTIIAAQIEPEPKLTALQQAVQSQFRWGAILPTYLETVDLNV